MPFASMTQDDVAAFYELLDEYFESRKELFASWVNPNGSAGPSSSSHTNAPVHAPAAAPVAPTSARMTAPPPPISRNSPAPPPPAPASPSNAGYNDAATAKAAKPQPTNKYGITVPSMSDFRDPKFQQGFKFAGSAASAAGGLINKHVMGNSPSAANNTGNAPPPASKPSGLAGKAMSFAQNKMMAPPAPNAATNTSVPLPPSSPAPARGNGRGIGSATAQYDYSSSESGDLSFKAGDSITLLAKESADWWRGEFRGRQGLFPASYVAED